jgi:hypothetical protein
VDNAGANAPYVLVSSVFEGGAYRVQPGQRVMFQHGGLREVVDQEKEPCGCPPAAVHGNEFPLAQSEGLAPLAAAAPSTTAAQQTSQAKQTQTAEALSYNGADHALQPAETAPPAASANATSNADPNTAANPAPAKKSGILAGLGRFFRRIFGAE